jgi:hypothetical protein
VTVVIKGLTGDILSLDNVGGGLLGGLLGGLDLGSVVQLLTGILLVRFIILVKKSSFSNEHISLSSRKSRLR